MQAQSLSWTLLAVLLFFTSADTGHADEWLRLSALAPGTSIRVETVEHGVLMATLVTVDDQALTAKTGSGIHTLAWANVRRVLHERPAAKLAPWLSMAIGGITVGAAASGQSDFTDSGRAIWTGVGAGAGALGGALLRRATRFVRVYESDAPGRGPVDQR